MTAVTIMDIHLQQSSTVELVIHQGFVMPRSRAQILAAIQKLQKQAETLDKAERAGAIKEARAIIGKYALTAGELGVRRAGKAQKGPSRKIPPKYRGPDGSTWSGRGKRPVWMRVALANGRKVKDFIIKKKS